MKAELVYFPYDTNKMYCKLSSKHGLYRPDQDEKSRYSEVWIPWDEHVGYRGDEWKEESLFKWLLNFIF